MSVTIIGAGLAGSEAAWQLASRGIQVHLHEMRPDVMTKAHKTAKAAELVCSNSFRGRDLANAVGLLKEELRILGSLIMQAADHAEVPAGGALAVDREVFSAFIDEKLSTHPLIERITGEILAVPESTPEEPVIVATGPLTSKELAKSIEGLTGSGSLAFFVAISPIILGTSIVYGKVFRQSRYDKGGDDYLNIPLSREQYYKFIEDVQQAEKFGGHEEVESDEVDSLRPFEGCMPIEEMISRGPDTLLFGPFKPVGITDPNTGKRPYANVQLRQDDRAGTLWSMVGLQTRMRHGEQQRILKSLPGLENAEFVRLGSVHRNTFIDSPKCLNRTLQFRGKPGLFFAGQVTGVEGYVESTAGGMVAGLNVSRLLRSDTLFEFSENTAIGALMHYISEPGRKEFQPMNISFGLMPGYSASPKKDENGKRLGKRERRLRASARALEELSALLGTSSETFPHPPQLAADVEALTNPTV